MCSIVSQICLYQVTHGVQHISILQSTLYNLPAGVFCLVQDVKMEMSADTSLSNRLTNPFHVCYFGI